MPNVTAGYRKLSDLIAQVSKNFTYIITCLKHYNFYIFKVTFQVTTIFATSWKKVLWTIYNHVSDNSKKCLSIGYFGILYFVVVCLYRVYTLHQLM